jgi:hypothetical protein
VYEEVSGAPILRFIEQFNMNVAKLGPVAVIHWPFVVNADDGGH